MKIQNKILIASIILGIYFLSMASALTISQVSSSPDEIQPGERVTIDLTIDNNMNDDVTEVRVALNLNGESQTTAAGLIQVFPSVPLSPYQSSNTQSIDKIREDNSKEASFDLIANADADSATYSIPVDISYTFNKTRKTDSGVISVIVNAKPLLSVTSDTSGVIKGQTNDVSIKIVNSGLGNAKFLELQVNPVSGAQITGADSFYIGDLNKDDFDTEKLSLFVDTNSAGTINIPLTISYKDSRNKEYTESFNLQVKAYTQNEAISIGLMQRSYTSSIILVVILIVVAYIVYRIIRGILRRRKNNKEM